MSSMKPIVKGSTVKYKGGYYRVTRKTRHTFNLGAMFTSHVYHQRVPHAEVVEAYDEWYAKWSASETYKSM